MESTVNSRPLSGDSGTEVTKAEDSAKEVEAYERGRDARYMEKCVRSNPFPIDSAERSAWYRGWMDHDREISSDRSGQLRFVEQSV
jgi:hypothetical protein